MRLIHLKWRCASNISYTFKSFVFNGIVIYCIFGKKEVRMGKSERVTFEIRTEPKKVEVWVENSCGFLSLMADDGSGDGPFQLQDMAPLGSEWDSITYDEFYEFFKEED